VGAIHAPTYPVSHAPTRSHSHFHVTYQQIYGGHNSSVESYKQTIKGGMETHGTTVQVILVSTNTTLTIKRAESKTRLLRSLYRTEGPHQSTLVDVRFEFELTNSRQFFMRLLLIMNFVISSSRVDSQTTLTML